MFIVTSDDTAWHGRAHRWTPAEKFQRLWNINIKSERALRNQSWFYTWAWKFRFMPKVTYGKGQKTQVFCQYLSHPSKARNLLNSGFVKILSSISLARKIKRGSEDCWSEYFILQMILLWGKSKALEINRAGRLIFAVMAVLKKKKRGRIWLSPWNWGRIN